MRSYVNYGVYYFLFKKICYIKMLIKVYSLCVFGINVKTLFFPLTSIVFKFTFHKFIFITSCMVYVHIDNIYYHKWLDGHLNSSYLLKMNCTMSLNHTCWRISITRKLLACQVKARSAHCNDVYMRIRIILQGTTMKNYYYLLAGNNIRMKS